MTLVPAAYAEDSSAVSTYVGGAFNWSNTALWTGGTIANGTGAVATFSNNYTSGVQVNFGLGGGDTNLTLGAINYTDTTPSSQLTLQGGTASTANLTFDDSDGVSEINVATVAGIPLQFGNSGTLHISGDDNLRISVTGTINPVRISTNVNWSNQTGKVTLAAGRFQTENTNVLPGAAEIEIGDGVQLRALLNQATIARNQSIKGLSGGNAASMVGTSDNANADGLLTLGNGTIASNSYVFTGTLGGNAFTAGAGNENSRFDVTKIGSGTQKFAGSSFHTGTTTINGGVLLINGVHGADTSLSGNLVSIATRGDYVVNTGGTLGGTGTIKPYDTAGGGGVLIDIAAGGTLSPGDGGVGTLMLDNTGAARSILRFSTDGLGAFDLGAGATSDTVAIRGSASLATEVIFNNTTLHFTDLTAGSLTPGDYRLFDGDANVLNSTGYGGLTLGGPFSGPSFAGTLITGGLVIGTGLAGYSGAKLFLSGNDIYVNITAVPEPATCATFAGLGALGLVGLKRRRA